MESVAAPKYTLDTLKELVENEIAALEKLMDSRSAASDARAIEAQEAIKVGLAAAQTALAAAAALAKEAVTEAKASHAAEHAALAMALALAMLELKERLAEMNNFRDQIAEERTDFVTRDRLAAAVSAMEGALAAAVVTFTSLIALQEVKIVTLQTQLADLRGRLTAYITALGVGVTVVELFLRFIIR